MAEERSSFAYQVVPLDFRRSGDRRADLLDAAEMLANQLVEASDGHFEAIPPVLLIEQEGDFGIVEWLELHAIDAADFQDFVVPETLRALDPDAVALICLTVSGQDGDGAWMMMCAIDRAAANQAGVTLEAPVVEEHYQTFSLGAFEPAGQGVPTQFASILRRPS
jgi:hypothetical protein